MLPTRLRGAQTHNLKSLDLEVLPGEILALTGVSGSGKSSLAQDTLYAEGQRRFVESFSPYARQFLERLQRPPMESLSPVGAGVSVDRGAPIKSSRSTLATMADLEAYLAGLFATESIPFCPEHPVAAQHLDLKRGTTRILTKFKKQRILICSPALVGSKEEYLSLRIELLREGFRRVLCAGKLYDLDNLKPSVAVKAGRLHVVMDRVAADRASESRIADALESSFRRSAGVLSDGQCFIHGAEGSQEPLQLREGLSCPECARALQAPRPGYFSYESPLAACQTCRGFGSVMGIDRDKVIPDDRLSLSEGAIRPWRGPKSTWERKQLKKFCLDKEIPWEKPWSTLSAVQKEEIFEGSKKRGRANYWGVVGWFEWLSSKAYKMHVRVFLARYRAYDPCPECAGSRLKESSLWYKLGGLDLSEWHRLEVSEALVLLRQTEMNSTHGKILATELEARLTYLSRVGLGYLSLDRSARTLSGGEAQRVTLTAALGTSLCNALFVIDEPTVGLHPVDVEALTGLIRELADRDNAVIVIEHDPLVIQKADRVVELGPGAGEGGGRLVFDGSVAKARKSSTATARTLAPLVIKGEEPPPRRGAIRIKGARAHNLKGVDLQIPLGRLICVSGPSGSGKSSLVVDVLYRSVARHLRVSDVPRPGPCSAIEGLESFQAVQLVDQSPLGRTSRGNPATYTKAWDVVRKAFAAEVQAKAHGFTASHFSFNVAGGRCEACSGEGYETIEMQFLADVSLVCPVCSGGRFKDEVLRIRFRGHCIADVLAMPVSDAMRLFDDSAPIRRALAPLISLGLGYIRLGQPLSTLSGGEAQRLKLARALSAPKPDTLYILDEPTAGLHVDEVTLLIEALRVLVRSGGTVVLVDHDLAMIGSSDWVIELGPGGGSKGGELVFSGTPVALGKAKTCTGRALLAATSLAGSRKIVPRRKAGKKKKELVVRGAREHSLRDVGVSIPHQKLSVVTGPSGSGKSTLAFDVVFAEGQRRFLETLTPYARRFLPALPRPDVDAVDGVPPSIALEQRTTRVGARSTVATVTEIAHYLRLAFAKLGTPYCPDHDEAITHCSSEELWALVQGTPGQGELRAKVVRARKGNYLEVFSSAARAGFAWAVADGKRVSTDEPPRLAKTKEHTIELVVREKLRFADLSLAELREALSWGRGTAALVEVGKKGSREIRHLSTGGVCRQCSFSIGDIDPRTFSFNTLQGQCSSCEGTGLAPLAKSRGKRKVSAMRKPCAACQGARLGKFPRRVQLLGHTYPSMTALSVGQLYKESLLWAFDGRAKLIAEPIVKELRRRLAFLAEVGLDYLNLDRDASTLSGGELQRLRLSAQLGADLTGALYVLDEPTIGLHPRDTGRLLDNLRRLVDTGSTVLMVEHDQDAIEAADYLIDLGPGGGTHGGRVMASGSPSKVLKNKLSPTGRAFRNPPTHRRGKTLGQHPPVLELTGATAHNLVGDRLRIPIGALTVVAGVSGSGKSSLISGVLLPALQKTLSRVGEPPGPFKSLRGIETLKRALAVDQSPIGRTPRSVPATFLGIFDLIRKLFAKTNDAQLRGFSASRFSFNTPKGGRCLVCEGQGVLSHEMSFLPDAVTTCPACEGMRFESRSLEPRYLGHNIGEVLALSCEEATRVFAVHPKICAPLQVLCDLGAGYIALGQGSHTLSGGEAQRLKLAAELAAGARHEPTLYVLDEPTTGLHLSDVGRLVEVLSRLVDRGDTCVVIEHQPDVIASADWIVELGPEGGPSGGRIVYQGPTQGLFSQATATAEVLGKLRKKASPFHQNRSS